MNVALWVMQVLLALHTAMGALWKISNSEQTVASLKALPHGAWVGLGVVELLCAVCLLVPAVRKSLGVLAPVAAALIAAEMLLFSGVHLASGETEHAELVYWLVVAAFCAFLAYGRWVLRPIKA
jgi:DoxX-like family